MDNKFNKNIVVLIPTYNPSIELIDLVDKLVRKGLTIVVVNDGSDRSHDWIFHLLSFDVNLVTYEENRGKGYALKRGFQYIKDVIGDAEIVVTADDDGQHTIEDIMAVIKKVRATGNIVIGSRSFDGKVPFRSRFGNRITSLVLRIFAGINLKDTQSGLRGFKTSLIPTLLDIEGDRYEYEMNMILRAARERIPIEEEHISTIYIKKNKKSHFKPLKDSLRIYSTFLKFGGSSFLSFLIDFIMVLTINKLLGGFFTSETSLLISVITARLVSSCINYMLNYKFVFRSNNFVSSLIRYYVLAGGILIANYCLLYLLNLKIGIPLFLAKLITEMILFVINYFVQQKVVFKNKINKERVA